MSEPILNVLSWIAISAATFLAFRKKTFGTVNVGELRWGLPIGLLSGLLYLYLFGDDNVAGMVGGVAVWIGTVAGPHLPFMLMDPKGYRHLLRRIWQAQIWFPLLRRFRPRRMPVHIGLELELKRQEEEDIDAYIETRRSQYQPLPRANKADAAPDTAQKR